MNIPKARFVMEPTESRKLSCRTNAGRRPLLLPIVVVGVGAESASHGDVGEL